MKKWLAMLFCLLMLPMGASAEVYQVESEADVPQEWAEKETMRLTCIDTDRSDAMLLECGGEAMMIDGGSGQYRNRVYSMLDSRGITQLKYLWSTHSDNDHIHGFVYLMRSGNYEVGSFLSPNAETYKDKAGYHQMAVKAVRAAEIPYVQIDAGDEVTLGTANLKVLRCPEPWGQNDRSATCMIQFGTAKAFITGDIDNKTMKWYAQTYGEELACDMLKIPHHGLATVPDSFNELTNAKVMFVPSTSKRCKDKFAKWAKKNVPDTPVYYSGDGAVVMLTDGTDWYVWQEPNYTEKK